ncbi:MAG: lipoprotein [Pseudomonadota bacterium]
MSPLSALLLGSAALALAACGVKGPISGPEGRTFPQTYPAPSTVVPNYQGGAVEPAPGPASLEQPIEPGFEDPEDALSIENQ